MNVFRIGQTEVAYKLRRAAIPSERRITVVPGQVEVLALKDDDRATIDAFLNRKRRWLFNTLREFEGKVATRAIVPRLMTGSKVPYRGRRVSLKVQRGSGPDIEIEYKGGFVVTLPAWVTASAAEGVVATELKLWLKRTVRNDVRVMVEDYSKRFRLRPRAVRVSDLSRGWGSCGAKGSISINWHLVFAPKRVLEYVVAHELAHLRYRQHGPRFWAFLQSIFPEQQAAKSWLERNGASLGDDFLNR